jgi:hypothetical protein
MPRLIPIRLAAACALALVLSLSSSASTFAKGFTADLRVVGSGGKLLAEKTLSTATTTLQTDPKASCFGAGSGGSGDKVTVPGNTALGLLARGAGTIGSLKPLALSDHFDFGLALCGVGSSVAKGSASWYLKINHKALSVSGDAAKIRPGDEVLYDLATTEPPSYSYPDELALRAPAKATAGMPFTVTVFSYDEKGRRKPAAGVKVTGAGAPTGANGKATVVLSEPALLSARDGERIPSNRAAVCVGGRCPGGSR